MQASGMLIEKIHQSGDDLVSLDREERRLIYQWQQFAADMETLAEFRQLVRRTYDYETKHGTHCVNIQFPSRLAKSFYGPDIYTAARKAVEALEKGEGDAQH